MTHSTTSISAPCAAQWIAGSSPAMTSFIIPAMHLRIRALLHVTGTKEFQSLPKKRREAKRRKARSPRTASPQTSLRELAQTICRCGASSAEDARLPALHRGSRQRLPPCWLNSRPCFLGRGETCDPEKWKPVFRKDHTSAKQACGRYPPSPVPVQGLHLPHRP